LGPLENILKQKMEEYKTYEEKIKKIYYFKTLTIKKQKYNFFLYLGFFNLFFICFILFHFLF